MAHVLSERSVSQESALAWDCLSQRLIRPFRARHRRRELRDIGQVKLSRGRGRSMGE